MRNKTRKTRRVVLSIEGLDKRIAPSGVTAIPPSQPVGGPPTTVGK